VTKCVFDSTGSDPAGNGRVGVAALRAERAASTARRGGPGSGQGVGAVVVVELLDDAPDFPIELMCPYGPGRRRCSRR
jgi:hypothetical protein